MKAIFLSDAHLRNAQDDNYKHLMGLLNDQQDLDALFLLGDIFEFWLGYRHLVFAAYVPLLEQLRQLTDSGTRLYFVEGNHDFSLGPYFSDTLGCTVITEQELIKWDGRSILLCHGDLINPTPAYLCLRKFWRSSFIKVLTRIIHPDPIWKLGLWLSNKSQKKKPLTKNNDPTPWLQTFAANSVNDHYDLLICGHFHFPVLLEENNQQIIALGDWQSRRCYAELVDGRITLKTYPG
ncbi:MAG: UDP-2,3-diacylglucosamine diphosphatase [Pelovirga sp.]